MNARRRHASLILAALTQIGTLAGSAWGQDQTKPDQAKPDQAKPEQAKPEQPKQDQPKQDQNKPTTGAESPLAKLPPPVRLGARVTIVKRASRIADLLVIVPTDAAYAAAIASWTPDVRFPVLVDDGTAEAADRIALFARSYKPAKIVRWEGKNTSFPAEPGARMQAMESIISRTLGLSEEESKAPGALDKAMEKMAGLNMPPVGVVLVDAADASWTAGLALAAGHAQPIAMFRYAYGPVGSVPQKESEQIGKLAIAVAERLKLDYKTLGDTFDAITICANIPTKADTAKPGEFAALTDLVGRVEGSDTERWAWSGQVYARTASEGAYNAMCSLFLTPDTGWLFNGYESGKDWDTYAQRGAAEAFNLAKLKASIVEYPDGTDRTWKARTRQGIDAGIVFIGSMGNADFFDLRGGRAKPGDIPMLKQPAVVYMIHSWSMTSIASRETVGGRWLDRGAFCYFGSVQEPYLNAFLPPSLFAARMLAGCPWGAMFGTDKRELWKVGSVGDPLFTITNVFGKDPARVAAAFPLANAENPARPLDELMREALKGQDLAEAVRNLTLMGRDKDAVDVFTATLKDAPKKVDAKLARAAIGACAREGSWNAVVRAFDALSPSDKLEGRFRDLLWLAAGDPTAKPDSITLGLLRNSVRKEQAARDCVDLGNLWSRAYNKAQAATMLEQVRDQSADADIKAGVTEALKAFR